MENLHEAVLLISSILSLIELFRKEEKKKF